MKYKNVLYTAVISTLCLGITSCSDFLDEMPVFLPAGYFLLTVFHKDALFQVFRS